MNSFTKSPSLAEVVLLSTIDPYRLRVPAVLSAVAWAAFLSLRTHPSHLSYMIQAQKLLSDLDRKFGQPESPMTLPVFPLSDASLPQLCMSLARNRLNYEHLVLLHLLQGKIQRELSARNDLPCGYSVNSALMAFGRLCRQQNQESEFSEAREVSLVSSAFLAVEYLWSLIADYREIDGPSDFASASICKVTYRLLEVARGQKPA